MIGTPWEVPEPRKINENAISFMMLAATVQKTTPDETPRIKRTLEKAHRPRSENEVNSIGPNIPGVAQTVSDQVQCQQRGNEENGWKNDQPPVDAKGIDLVRSLSD